MPTDTNLLTQVHLYLELIARLFDLSDGLDTSTPESKRVLMEVEHYMGLIRQEMRKKDENN